MRPSPLAIDADPSLVDDCNRGSVGPNRMRPRIPALLSSALVAWASCALMLEIEFYLDPFERILACLVLVIASLILALISLITRHHKLLLAALFLIAGISCTTIYCSALATSMERVADEISGIWTIRLLEDAKGTEFGCKAEAIAMSEGRSYKVLAYLPDGLQALCQQEFDARARFSMPKVDMRKDYWDRGIVANCQVDEVSLQQRHSPIQPFIDFRASAIEKMLAKGGSDSALLCAIVCGYRPPISEDGLYDEFKSTGLAHLVAVSGAHLAIVTSMVLALLGKFGLHRGWKVGAASMFIAFYLAFSGMPISAIRASIMAILGIVSPFANRRSSPLSALALCMMVFVASDPSCAISASFVLSAGSTLGIILFSGLFAEPFAFLGRRLRAYVGEPIALTLASSLVTLPYSASTFGQLPLASPIANVLASVPFTVSCSIGLLCTMVAQLFPASEGFAMALARMLANPLIAIAGLVSSIPNECIPIYLSMTAALAITLLACSALYVVWPRISMRAFLSLSVAALFIFGIWLAIPKMHPDDRIVMLDVGQGDAFLISSKGSNMLVDTGTNDGLLKEGLARLGIFQLDCVLLTHPDDDHCGSISSLCSYVEVGKVLVAQGLKDCECEKCERLEGELIDLVGEEDVVGLRKGSGFSLGSFDMKVIWPGEFKDAGGNADSLCFRMSADVDSDGMEDASALFVGDAESEQLERMLEEGSLCDADILKVGHHGSKASLSEDILESLDVKVGLLSVGKNNRYGHPSKQTIQCLEGAGVECFRTDLDGCVTLHIKPKGSIEVETERQP